MQHFSFSHTFSRHILQTEGCEIALLCKTQAAYRVGSGLKLFLCYLCSLMANDFGKFFFTTIQFELFKHGVYEK